MTENLFKVPGRKSPLILDFVYDLTRNGYLQFFTDAWQEYGDLARFQIGPGNMFLVIHPEHVRHISIANRQNYTKGPSYDVVRELLLGNGVLTSTGDLWRRQRKLMAPFFTPRGIESYFSTIYNDGLWMQQRWEGLAASGETVEMIDEMMMVTASIILKTMFSMDSDEDILELKGAVETMIRYITISQTNPLYPPLWVPTRANRAYLRARREVHTYIDRVIAQRRAIPEDEWPDDLLGKLMLAEDDETGERMSDELLRDESITIFFAGHETTATTLTFLWYSLATNPEVEARLHAEIDAVLGDGPLTLEQVGELEYTLQVIKETLRLYPAVPTYVRDAVEDDEIDGYHIPAGSRMMLWPFLTHRHPDFWERPEAFDPDRWEPACEKARHPYAFHAFAAGQRTCLGNNFSLFESQVLVALLARHFTPRLAVPGFTPQVEMAGTLASRNGLPMRIAKRS